jgi:RNA polymerase sigma factor (sigma-70 family)
MTTNIIESLSQTEWDKLILNILKPFISYSRNDPLISVEDLKQEAWIGLLTAAEKFDPSKSTKFVTFAYYYIYGRILRYTMQKSKFKSMRLNQDVETMEEEVAYEDTECESSDMVKSIMALVSDQEHSDLLIEHFMKNKSYRTIAKERGLSHQCIHLRINKLKKILKQRLHDANS